MNTSGTSYPFIQLKETTMNALSTPETAALTAVVQLLDSERQPCEVWTRVMGYHRPVASFNIGKQGEHHERQFFAEK
ncbi:Uncharacterised protein [uncultured Comamonas sp.]|nr:Uncharacterised protein [uncultured Comamonas sp.]